jgi:hypothetical protein
MTRHNGSFERADLQILDFLHELADPFNQLGSYLEGG